VLREALAGRDQILVNGFTGVGTTTKEIQAKHKQSLGIFRLMW
jgi:hypothetical protein